MSASQGSPLTHSPKDMGSCCIPGAEPVLQQGLGPHFCCETVCLLFQQWISVLWFPAGFSTVFSPQEGADSLPLHSLAGPCAGLMMQVTPS